MENATQEKEKMSTDHSKALDEISHLRVTIKEILEERKNLELKIEREMAEKNKQLEDITLKLNCERDSYNKKLQSKNDLIEDLKIRNDSLKEELSREKRTVSENMSIHKSKIEEKLNIETNLKRELVDSQNKISCFESDMKVHYMETERLNKIILQLRDGFTKLERTHANNAKEKEVLAKEYEDLKLKNETLSVCIVNTKKESQQCMSKSLSEIESLNERFRKKCDEHKNLSNESTQKLKLYENDILVWKNRAIAKHHLIEEKSAEILQMQSFYSQETNKILSQVDELTVKLAISKEVGNYYLFDKYENHRMTCGLSLIDL